VGYAGKWDRTVVEGDIAARDCSVTYYRDGRALATATIYRDRHSLTTELAMERASHLDPAALVLTNLEG
jgi:3-phenylpropionate/trans-cinnamate dioxygenase ferredoxin reductase subunit